MTHVTPLPDDLIDSDTSFLGPPIVDAVAAAVCDGDIDPFSLQPFSSELAKSADGSDLLLSDKYSLTRFISRQPPSASVATGKSLTAIDRYFKVVGHRKDSIRSGPILGKKRPRALTEGEKLQSGAFGARPVPNDSDTGKTTKASKYFPHRPSPSRQSENAAELLPDKVTLSEAHYDGDVCPTNVLTDGNRGNGVSPAAGAYGTRRDGEGDCRTAQTSKVSVSPRQVGTQSPGLKLPFDFDAYRASAIPRGTVSVNANVRHTLRVLPGK